MAVNDLDNIIARLDLYENSVVQLKRELPTFFQKYTETSKSFKGMKNSLRTSASCESNAHLQKSLFLTAQCYETLENECVETVKTNEILLSQIDELTSMSIVPFREIVNDFITSRKSISDPVLMEHTERSLVVNQRLFEKHRVRQMHSILARHLRAELKYHCRAVEEISSALQTLLSATIQS